MTKVSELSAERLDYWVARAKGSIQRYSSDWSQGGPIIERDGIALRPAGWPSESGWYASMGDAPEQQGETPLLAAMRAYVAAKVGNEVEER